MGNYQTSKYLLLNCFFIFNSVGIIIAGILVGLTQSNVPDIVIGGGIGLLICYSAIRIFKESMDVNRTQS